MITVSKDNSQNLKGDTIMKNIYGENIKKTPCEIKGDDGHYHCPYAEFYDGDEMCRVCCGLGVDENEEDYE